MARIHGLWRGAIAVSVSIAVAQLLRLGNFLLVARLRGMTLSAGDYRDLLLNPAGGEPRVFLLFYALPVLIYVALTNRFGPAAADAETRCRKCGYILRGISEPRCPECGEQI